MLLMKNYLQLVSIYFNWYLLIYSFQLVNLNWYQNIFFHWYQNFIVISIGKMFQLQLEFKIYIV